MSKCSTLIPGRFDQPCPLDFLQGGGLQLKATSLINIVMTIKNVKNYFRVVRKKCLPGGLENPVLRASVRRREKKLTTFVRI